VGSSVGLGVIDNDEIPVPAGVRTPVVYPIASASHLNDSVYSLFKESELYLIVS